MDLVLTRAIVVLFRRRKGFDMAKQPKPMFFGSSPRVVTSNIVKRSSGGFGATKKGNGKGK